MAHLLRCAHKVPYLYWIVIYISRSPRRFTRYIIFVVVTEIIIRIPSDYTKALRWNCYSRMRRLIRLSRSQLRNRNTAPSKHGNLWRHSISVVCCTQLQNVWPSGFSGDNRTICQDRKWPEDMQLFRESVCLSAAARMKLSLPNGYIILFATRYHHMPGSCMCGWKIHM